MQEEKDRECSFDDFLKEEGILEEAEEHAREWLREREALNRKKKRPSEG